MQPAESKKEPKTATPSLHRRPNHNLLLKAKEDGQWSKAHRVLYPN